MNDAKKNTYQMWKVAFSATKPGVAKKFPFNILFDAKLFKLLYAEVLTNQQEHALLLNIVLIIYYQL